MSKREFSHAYYMAATFLFGYVACWLGRRSLAVAFSERPPPFASRRRRERKERIIIAQTEKNTEGKREEDSAAFSRLLFLFPLTLTLAPLQEEEREEEEEEGIRGQLDLPQKVGEVQTEFSRF